MPLKPANGTGHRAVDDIGRSLPAGQPAPGREMPSAQVLAGTYDERPEFYEIIASMIGVDHPHKYRRMYLEGDTTLNTTRMERGDIVPVELLEAILPRLLKTGDFIAPYWGQRFKSLQRMDWTYPNVPGLPAPLTALVKKDNPPPPTAEGV